jgi:arsenate reductase (thioredoxin)
MAKSRILFLCTGNSCRSQMAEGFARALRPDIEASSAGVMRHGVNPWAVKAMAEAGVDISGQVSKTVEELPTQEFDFVVTLCDHAAENCPFFPGQAKRIQAAFDDPPALAKGATNEEEIMTGYRRVRDEIKAFILDFPRGE